jgi:hypothetical protein
MVVTIVGILLAVAQVAASQSGATPQLSPRLDDRIGTAKGSLPCDEALWRNPLIDLQGDTVLLRALSSREPRRLTVDELDRVLTSLPPSDWPYGRIVALPSSTNPHRSGTSDDVLAAIPKVVLRVGVHAMWFWPMPKPDSTSPLCAATALQK